MEAPSVKASRKAFGCFKFLGVFPVFGGYTIEVNVLRFSCKKVSFSVTVTHATSFSTVLLSKNILLADGSCKVYRFGVSSHRGTAK